MITMQKFRSIFLILVISLCGEIMSYNYLPNLTCYEKQDYKAGRQNWDIEIDEYNTIIQEASDLLKLPEAPAMPVCANLLNAQSSHGPVASSRGHQDQISESGFVSDEWFALVQKQVSIKQAMDIPNAKQAVWNNKYSDRITVSRSFGKNTMLSNSGTTLGLAKDLV